MKNLLKFEFRKLLRQKSAWVCGIIIICSAVLAVALEKLLWTVNSQLDDEALGLMTSSMSSPSALSLALSIISSCSFAVILAVFTAIFMSEDRSEGILKNIYSKGYGRINVFFSKLIATCAYCAVTAIICYIIAFVGGIALFPDGDFFDTKSLLALPVQLLLLLAYNCMYCMISAFMKKTGGAIACCILIPTVTTLGASILDAMLNLRDFYITSFLLDGMLANLTYAPIEEKALVIGLVGSIVYGGIFCLAGLQISRKTQI